MRESIAWRRIAEEVDGERRYYLGIWARLYRARLSRKITRKQWRSMESSLTGLEPLGLNYWPEGKEGRNCRVLACLFLAAMTEG